MVNGKPIRDRGMTQKIRAAAGIAIGFACFLVLAHLVPDSVCRDGWQSPSIGRQGACSHHGGVRIYSALYLPIFGVATFLGLWIGGGLPRRGIKSDTVNSAPHVFQSTEEQLIRAAIEEKKRLCFLYCKHGSSRWTQRRVRPMQYRERLGRERVPAACLVAFCEERQAERIFLLRRMRDLIVVD